MNNSRSDSERLLTAIEQRNRYNPLVFLTRYRLKSSGDLIDFLCCWFPVSFSGVKPRTTIYVEYDREFGNDDNATYFVFQSSKSIEMITFAKHKQVRLFPFFFRKLPRYLYECYSLT